MFFVVSKIAYFFIMPFTIVVGLLVASAFIKNLRWKKLTFRTGIILLVFFSNDFIASRVMSAWEVDAIAFSEVQQHKLGIVLTGATISNIVPDDRVYFSKGADRVVHTVQLYKLKLIDKILISGGSGKLIGESEPEANKFKRAMILMGVPGDDIIIENATRNTGESSLEVQRLLIELGYQETDCLLITSAFHMRRSLAAFRKAGLELQPFSTDFYTTNEINWQDFIIPQIDAFGKWHKLVKEWVGLVAYKMAGYV